MQSLRQVINYFLCTCFLMSFGRLDARHSFEPEEPDYAFIAGGPYTQAKNSVQIILSNYYTREDLGSLTEQRLINSLRLEWGFSNRLEGDIVFQYANEWTEVGGNVGNVNGFGDTVVGLRYRLLQESLSPITLTLGPQLIIPTGDESRGFGDGNVGGAWDLTVAREWTIAKAWLRANLSGQAG